MSARNFGSEAGGRRTLPLRPCWAGRASPGKCSAPKTRHVMITVSGNCSMPTVLRQAVDLCCAALCVAQLRRQTFIFCFADALVRAHLRARRFRLPQHILIYNIYIHIYIYIYTHVHARAASAGALVVWLQGQKPQVFPLHSESVPLSPSLAEPRVPPPARGDPSLPVQAPSPPQGAAQMRCSSPSDAQTGLTQSVAALVAGPCGIDSELKADSDVGEHLAEFSKSQVQELLVAAREKCEELMENRIKELVGVFENQKEMLAQQRDDITLEYRKIAENYRTLVTRSMRTQGTNIDDIIVYRKTLSLQSARTVPTVLV